MAPRPGRVGLLTAHDLVLCLDDYFAEADPDDELGFTLWTKAGAAEAGLALVERDDGWPPYLQAAETREENGATVLTPIPGTCARRLRKIVAAPLIVLAGRSGEPPYVSPVEVECLKAVWCPRTHRRIGVRTVYVTPLDTVCRERADYAAWHHATTALADALQACRVSRSRRPACRRGRGRPKRSRPEQGRSEIPKISSGSLKGIYRISASTTGTARAPEWRRSTPAAWWPALHIPTSGKLVEHPDKSAER